jgi:trans-L-3-hydroxyproline dehydratase
MKMNSQPYQLFQAFPSFSVPNDWEGVHTIDLHTEGEPLRVILSGFPELKGKSLLTCRKELQEQWDSRRRSLIWEPRGHADMYACLILPPFGPDADIAAIFLHNEGYSSMCGHGVIALATLFAEMNWIPLEAPLARLCIEVPAGEVVAHARVKSGRVVSAFFDNVPAYVVALDQSVAVEGLGEIRFDIAYGGAYYAYVDAEAAGIDLSAANAAQLISYGKEIKQAVAKQAAALIQHPLEADLSFLYGVIFTGNAHTTDPLVHSRHVCVFAEGEIDRSPTGTGVSGRLALLHARKHVFLRQPLTFESIIGGQFQGEIMAETEFGPHEAIIPRVEGRAYLTGQHHFFRNPEDPFGAGFLLR